jgi:lipopolysaccharide/colanic/teichoic acid biosynthesis glycosyltransferase
MASRDTGEKGFFIQLRVGMNNKPFNIMKIRTMISAEKNSTVVTTDQDPRITKMGHFWRKTKIDELPQLINVLKGDMSFVGPRPDVPGFADLLEGEDRLILSVRPGITGPATLKYRNEEALLSKQNDPEIYNQTVLYPDKVRINLDYIKHYSFRNDIKYILETVMGKIIIQKNI